MTCSWGWVWPHGQRSESVVPCCFRFAAKRPAPIKMYPRLSRKTAPWRVRWPGCHVRAENQLYPRSCFSVTACSAGPTASRFSRNGCRGFLELRLLGASFPNNTWYILYRRWFGWAALRNTHSKTSGSAWPEKGSFGVILSSALEVSRNLVRFLQTWQIIGSDQVDWFRSPRWPGMEFGPSGRFAGQFDSGVSRV